MRPAPEFRVGEAVRVLDGPFVNFVGVVAEALADADSVRVTISIFGRQTLQEFPRYWLERIA